MRVLLWSDSGRLLLQCNAGEDRARRVQQPHEARIKSSRASKQRRPCARSLRNARCAAHFTPPTVLGCKNLDSEITTQLLSCNFRI